MTGPTHAVLTTGSQLACAHGGQLRVHSRQSKLAVDGKPVLLFSDLAGTPISGCGTPASSSTKPCTTVVSALAGQSSTLAVDGTPVLTEQARGLTDGVSPQGPTWSVRSAGQTKLVAR